MIRAGDGLGYRFSLTSGKGISCVYAKNHLGYVYVYISDMIWKYGNGEGYGDGSGKGYTRRADDLWRKR